MSDAIHQLLDVGRVLLGAAFILGPMAAIAWAGNYRAEATNADRLDGW